MKTRKPVKLSKKNAVALIQRVITVPKALITGGADENGAIRYAAPLSQEGMKIVCENDWATLDGCVKVTVSDSACTYLAMYFNPNTFERNHVMEKYYTRER